jgi:hypothetical protein
MWRSACRAELLCLLNPQEECSIMTLTSRLVAGALASLLFTGTAFAQATAPQRRTSAEALECLKQADAKGLKGTARSKFRRECIRSARAGTAAPATAAPAEKTK